MLKKIITCLSITGLSILSTTSCTSTNTSTNKKETSTSVYLRKDISIKSDKVILFPTMYLTSGNFIEENKNFKGNIIDGKLLASWTTNIDKIKLIPVPRQVLNEIPGAWPSLNILVSMMDNSEDIKNNENYSVIEKFVHSITKKYGNNSVLALSVVFEDENEYISSHKVHKNIGLFDTKTMSWKWITKDAFENSTYLPIPYEVAVNKIISNSFEALKKENKNKLF